MQRCFMKRRTFLYVLGSITFVSPCLTLTSLGQNADASKDWLPRWKTRILSDEKNRYCDKEMGEELGWLVSPFLNGFYYGWLATQDIMWVEHFTDWADSCVKRGIRGPDNFPGWPKGNGGGDESKTFTADSLLGEAMMLRPMVLMSAQIKNHAKLSEKFGAKAESWIQLAETIFEKWISRDCWREVKNGGVWIVPDFGTDLKTGKWSSGYDSRKTTGFTNPDNKLNHIARWMLAMYDVTKKTVYRDHATQWFQVMRSRMKNRDRFFVWNYWEPAGPWDYKPDDSPKHWVGVHPNGGYYQIDVEAIVDGYEHGVVFSKEDIDRLIATNRDFMWNQKLDGARFQRMDGGEVDERWKNSPGLLWTSLVPYDATLKKIFLANHDPASWGGMSITPWFLSLEKARK